MSNARTPPQLRVAADQTHLETGDGQPWFYLADTAWQLFQTLSLQEAEHYLATRAAQGFNAVQAVAYPEIGGIDTPNAQGDLAMHNGDPARPNPAYFDHLAEIIARAAKHGLHVALLPAWGSHVTPAWATGPTAHLNPDSAAAYGAWLADRLREHANVIWVIGGDRPVETPLARQTWDALAHAIHKADPLDRLMAFHPPGGTSSSKWVDDADWLDLHWIQSGHWRQSADNGAMVQADVERDPRRPVIDAEPCYENHPVGMDTANPWLDAYDVRRAAWQAVLAGACGHTYGCHDVWMMATDTHRPLDTARGTWRGSLGLPGATQMRWVRWLAEARLLPHHVADPSLCPMPTIDSDRIAAARDGSPAPGRTRNSGHAKAHDPIDANCAVVYSPLRRPELTLNLTCLAHHTHVRTWWLNPRDGQTHAEATIEGTRLHEPLAVAFPEGGPDWVFVAESADLAPILAGGHAAPGGATPDRG